MKQVKSLLICNSNMFIPTVLTEVLSHPLEQYLIISDTVNVHRFFELMNLANVYYVKYGIRGRFDFICEKRNLFAKVNQYEIGQVVFFHAEFGEMANWLIKRLSKTTPIFYCKIYDSIPAPRCKQFMKVLKVKLRQWLYWGVKMDVLQHSNVFPSLPPEFFSNVHATTITMPIDVDLVSRYVSGRLGSINLDAHYVLLTGTCVSTGKSDVATYETLINRVIDILGAENTVSKCHPRFNDLYGKEKDLRQIPSFIPGNVLIDNYICYIGFESTLLVEAAIAGKKAVSLIYLLPLSNEEKIKFHDFFSSRLQNKGEILFPKTLEDLELILLD